MIVDHAGAVTTYCVCESPSQERVRQHAVAFGAHDVEVIYEIAGDVTPDDFPLT